MTKDDRTASVSPKGKASDSASHELGGREPIGRELIGRTLAGRYALVERLGSGSTGAVYRARDLEREVDVALKLVPAKSPLLGESRQRFECEAAAMKVLQSPHTVRIFDSGEADDGSCFLAMELLEGETLGARLKRGPLEPATAIRILEGALKSIVEAHDKGIVHRDLKPENLFLVSDIPGRPDFCKVLDFGIAKLEGKEFRPRATDRGTVLGTPRYMSPEQAQGALVDARSDLYSLGVILFQMLTGTVPFVAPDPVLVMAKHVRELPPSLTEVAPQLAGAPRLVLLVRKVLSKSPEDRPQTATDLLRQLQLVRRELGLLTHSTTTSQGVALSTTVMRRRTTNRAWYLSLCAACVGFIAIGSLAKSSAVGSRQQLVAAAQMASPVATVSISQVSISGASIAPEADLSTVAGPLAREVELAEAAQGDAIVGFEELGGTAAPADRAPEARAGTTGPALSAPELAEREPTERAKAPATATGRPKPRSAVATVRPARLPVSGSPASASPASASPASASPASASPASASPASASTAVGERRPAPPGDVLSERY